MAIAARKKRPVREKCGPLASPWFDRAAGAWKYPLNDRGRFRLLELIRACPDPWKLVAGDSRMAGVRAMLRCGRVTRDEILAEGYWAFVCAVKTFRTDAPIDESHVYSWVLNKVGSLANPKAKRDRIFRDTVRPDQVRVNGRSRQFDPEAWEMVPERNGTAAHEVKAGSMSERTLELLKNLTPEQRRAVECRHGLNGRPECQTFAALGERLGIDQKSAYALYARGIARLRRMMNAEGA